MIKNIVNYVKTTKLFWRLYFWWGMRQARKAGISKRLMPGYTGKPYQ